jgi:predicted outer membrane lipoprotein
MSATITIINSMKRERMKERKRKGNERKRMRGA